MNALKTNRGFTLVELALVIVIMGILGSVAVLTMNTSITTAQYEQTKREMEQLSFAIVGNPETYGQGARANFGYVGDVGAFPPNLDALLTSPGGYSTWDGPYIAEGFSSNDFKKDGWNTNYTYTDTLLRSTGSGSNIDKLVAASSTELFNRSVSGVFLDADMTMPNTTYDDSVLMRLVYPDGSGSTTTAATNPNAFGEFAFSSVPIGNHTLSVVYIPDTDTVSYSVTVLPGRDVKLDIVFPADLW